MFVLRRVCEESGAKIEFNLVVKGESGPGICPNSPPDIMVSFADKARNLRERLDLLRGRFNGDSTAAWLQEVPSLALQTRMLLEEAVVKVAGGVYKRFDHKVHTIGLRKLAAISEGGLRNANRSIQLVFTICSLSGGVTKLSRANPQAI